MRVGFTRFVIWLVALIFSWLRLYLIGGEGFAVAAVFKSLLVAAAVLLVGFGAAGAVWAEPVSANRVIPDPLVKHRPNAVDPLFSDAAIAARFASARAKDSVADVKGSGKRFKFEVHCGQGWDRRGAGSTDRQAPVVLKQVWVDETKRPVPVPLRPAQYPQLYTTGYVPASGEQSTGANVGQIGDFWAGMNRATMPAGGQESQTKVFPRTVSGENAK